MRRWMSEARLCDRWMGYQRGLGKMKGVCEGNEMSAYSRRSDVDEDEESKRRSVGKSEDRLSD